MTNETSKERYDFDKIVDRSGSYSAKYEALGGLKSDYDEILPLWVADMDFETPAAIREAITKSIADHPVLGYSVPPASFYDTIVDWFRDAYGISATPGEITYTPGVVAAIYKIIEALTKEDEGVTILPPVYFPFADVVAGSRRKEITAPLLIKENRYYIDWERLEEALSQSKLLIFCHPHNPGGRVWSREELTRVATLAKKYGVTVISDEIHADLTFKAFRHIPFPTVSEEARACGISLMAPSKFFNMPGVIASHMYIPDPELREKVFGYFERNHLNAASCFTFDAVTAAYGKSADWALAARDYCEKNVRYVSDFLKSELPRVQMIEPEASFLIFLDFRGLGFSSPEELHTFLIQKAGLLLNEGSSFGAGGAFFMRLNVGVPRAVLEEAMKRLKKALQERSEKE